MIYFCDKTQRRLPRLFHKIIANTSYALTDKRLNETQTLTGAHLTGECKLQIQQELLAINHQLSELDSKYTKLLQNQSEAQQHLIQNVDVEGVERGSLLVESISNKNFNTGERNYLSRISSRQADMNPTDALVGMHMLGFLIDFKKFIHRHDTNVRKAEIELVDVNLELERLKERTGNFHYINTLEAIKNMILNPAKASARANRHCLRNKKHRHCPHRQYFSSGDLTQGTSATVSPSASHKTYDEGGGVAPSCSGNQTGRPIKFHKLIAMRTEARKAKEFLHTLQSYKAQVRAYLDLTCKVDYESAGYVERLIKVPKKDPPPVVVDTATPATASTIDSREKLDPQQFEWRYLALVFDRVFFFFFSVLIPICIMVLYAKTVLM